MLKIKIELMYAPRYSNTDKLKKMENCYSRKVKISIFMMKMEEPHLYFPLFHELVKAMKNMQINVDKS